MYKVTFDTLNMHNDSVCDIQMTVVVISNDFENKHFKSREDSKDQI